MKPKYKEEFLIGNNALNHIRFNQLWDTETKDSSAIRTEYLKFDIQYHTEEISFPLHISQCEELVRKLSLSIDIHKAMTICMKIPPMES